MKSEKDQKIKRKFSSRRTQKDRLERRLKDYEGTSPRQARLAAKSEFKKRRKTRKEREKHLVKRHGRDAVASKNVFSSVETKNAKNDHKALKKQDDTYLVNRFKGAIKTGTTHQVKSSSVQRLKRELRNDDLLAEGVDSYDKVQQAKYYGRVTKSTGKVTGNVGKNITQGTYNGAVRLKNLLRGRGFQKTPYDKQFFGLRKQTSQARRKLQLKMRRQTRRFAGRYKKTTKVGRFFSRRFKNIFSDLFGKGIVRSKIVWVFIGLCAFCLILAGATGMPGLKQDNQEINETWLALTKEDAEHTDSTHRYFTDWQPFMFQLNGMFGDFDPKDTNQGAGYQKLRKFDDKGTYPVVLTKLYEETHKKSKALTSQELMDGKNEDGEKAADIIQNPWFVMNNDVRDEIDASRRMGFSVLGNELADMQDNPDDKPVQIARRYGYEKVNDKTELHDGNTIVVTPNQAVKAPLAGKVSVLNDHAIKIFIDKSHDLVVDGLTNFRAYEGQEIQEGDVLGDASSNQLELQYKLWNSYEKEWFSANVGFYFRKVEFLQFTSIVDDDFDPSSKVEDRALTIWQHLKDKGYTMEGVAAMIGNFAVESNINPKRAEGDYLKAPVGSSDNSWDDDNWLNMGGPQIYDGRFPNIIHRGLGLGQWTDVAPGPGGRNTALREYAKSKNKKWYSLTLQIDFMLEADSGANVAKSILSTKNTDVGALAIQFQQSWEGNPGDKTQERVQAALNWFSYLQTHGDDKTEADKKKSDQKKESEKKANDTIKEVEDAEKDNRSVSW